MHPSTLFSLDSKLWIALAIVAGTETTGKTHELVVISVVLVIALSLSIIARRLQTT